MRNEGVLPIIANSRSCLDDGSWLVCGLHTRRCSYATQEKSALVEAMEEEAEELMVGRAAAAAQRSEADEEDDQAVAGAAVSAALAALSRGGSLSGKEPILSRIPCF